MAKEGKKGFIQEFKEFAISGNLFDMAVGVLIGGMFKGLVDSFTTNILMPIVGIFTGGVDFKIWKIELPSLFKKAVEAAPVKGVDVAEATKEAAKAGNPMTYGIFISEVISFLILMLVVFLMVKGVNKAKDAAKKKEEAKPEEPAAPPEPSEEVVLLREIRDSLKK